MASVLTVLSTHNPASIPSSSSPHMASVLTVLSIHTILPLFPHPPHLTWPLLTVLSTHYPAPGFVSSYSSSLGGILQNSLSSVPFPMTGLDISTVCKACLCSFILGSSYSKIWCLLGHLLVLNASQEVKVFFYVTQRQRCYHNAYSGLIFWHNTAGTLLT